MSGAAHIYSFLTRQMLQGLAFGLDPEQEDRYRRDDKRGCPEGEDALLTGYWQQDSHEHWSYQ